MQILDALLLKVVLQFSCCVEDMGDPVPFKEFLAAHAAVLVA